MWKIILEKGDKVKITNEHTILEFESEIIVKYKGRRKVKHSWVNILWDLSKYYFMIAINKRGGHITL